MKVFWIIMLVCMMSCQPKKSIDFVVAEEASTADLSSLGNPTLSSYGFFVGDLKSLKPASGVLPYTINSPLFSDYAFKSRFVKIPEGAKAAYNESDVFDFPEGTVLIKNFYYPKDFRRPTEQIRLLETRLLILKNESWNALTYVWNEAQTEAVLDVAGKTIPISWTHTDGVLKEIEYSVPSVNQCKGCHLKGEKIMPIGPSARQLNRGESKKNQLIEWHEKNVLTGLPDLSAVPRLAAYEDEKETVSNRARAWLEINCAHCHRADGQAKTSGLQLAADVLPSMEIGIGKAPVAAGKGSGGRRFSIVPSRPDESILLYRIESTDPGIMMPEMGRRMVHTEGVHLVRRWILEMRP